MFMVITGLCSTPSMCLQMNLLVHLKSSKETLSMGSLIVQEENLWGCPYKPRARMSVLQNQLLSAPHNIEWSTPSSLLGRKWSMMMNLWFLPSVLLDFIDILLKNMQIKLSYHRSSGAHCKHGDHRSSAKCYYMAKCYSTVKWKTRLLCGFVAQLNLSCFSLPNLLKHGDHRSS